MKKVFYLLPVLVFTACLTPDEVKPVPEYEFEVWQCFDPDDLKICYSLSLPAPGYTIQVEGENYDFEVTSGDRGCTLNTATVLEGTVTITLLAEGIKDKKTIEVVHLTE